MIKKLTKNVYCMQNNSEKESSIIGLITGEKASLIIDAGNSTKQMDEFLKEVKKMNIPELKYLVFTHSHKNHIMGAQNLKFVNIVNGVTNDKLKKRCKDYNIQINSDIIYDEFLKLDLGNLVVELERIPSDHAKDCSIINIPSEKTVFLGDSLYSNNKYTEETFTVELMIPLLKELQCYEADNYITSHGQTYSNEEFLSYSDNIIKIGKCTKKENDINVIKENVTEKLGSLNNNDVKIIKAFINGKNSNI